MGTTTTMLLLGAVLLTCSRWTLASDNDFSTSDEDYSTSDSDFSTSDEDYSTSDGDFESPASPFKHFMSARSDPVKCPVTSKKCRKMGGYCVEKGSCNTGAVPGVFCNKKRTCECCAKDMSNICRPKKPCKVEKGFCVVNPKACARGGGIVLKGQCKCKSSSGRGHCCVPPAPESHSWAYSGEYGPEAWGDMYATCAGTLQSPIEVNTQADFDTLTYSVDPFVFTNYAVPPNDITIKNNGHSASITWNGFSPASISGGHLDLEYLGAEYTLAGFHFHWGSNNTKGSEHILDIADPLELHLVHYKTEYGDVDTAIQHAGGLAVLGVLFRIDSTFNPNLLPITNSLASIVEPGSETTVSFPYNLDSLLPAPIQPFYRYSGSLTTPTCNEVVIWTVFMEKLAISEDQMAAFRALKFDDGTAMVDNFRPPQALNGRSIKYVRDE